MRPLIHSSQETRSKWTSLLSTLRSGTSSMNTSSTCRTRSGSAMNFSKVDRSSAVTMTLHRSLTLRACRRIWARPRTQSMTQLINNFQAQFKGVPSVERWAKSSNPSSKRLANPSRLKSRPSCAQRSSSQTWSRNCPNWRRVWKRSHRSSSSNSLQLRRQLTRP